MQDQYVGDVGDFGKYGLLRLLCDAHLSPTLRLGVVWYRVANEPARGDGKFVNYLDRTSKNERRFRECDPELWDALHQIVFKDKNRTVEAIQTSGILPATTQFFSPPRNGSAETDWLRSAVEAVRGCDIVFLDPDNGLEISSVKAHQKRAAKYVFYHHVQRFLEQGQPSLVIYHHLPHRAADEEIADRLKELRRLQPNYCWHPVRYHRGTGRVFFLLESPKLRLDRVESLRKTVWFTRGHFSLAEGV